jgi:hypothetical protein
MRRITDVYEDRYTEVWVEGGYLQTGGEPCLCVIKKLKQRVKFMGVLFGYEFSVVVELLDVNYSDASMAYLFCQAVMET